MQTQKITLDFCQNDYKTVTVKQYDKDSRNLIITCTDNGAFYKLDSSTLQCNVKMNTPDDRAIYDTATINKDGTVLVTFSESMVYASGTGKLEIQFLDSSTKKSISTMILTVIIVGSVYPDDKIIASDEFNALTDALLKIEGDVNDANEAIDRINELEESIATAEASRIVAEESRVSSESKRASAENTRTTNENTRKTNETARQTAESKRQTDTATAIANAEEATEKANEIAENCKDLMLGSGISITTTETTLEGSKDGLIRIESIGGKCEQFTTTGKQLFNKNVITSGMNVGTDGSLYNDSKSFSTDYILVSGLSNIVTNMRSDSNGNTWGVFYTSNKVKVSAFNSSSAGGYVFAVPSEAYYVRIGCLLTLLDTAIVASGNVLPTYEPYTGGMPAPNPDYPQEIKKTVVSEIKTHGKNLAKEANVIDVSTIYHTVLRIKADFRPNTKYTFSFRGTVGNQYYTNENLFLEENVINIVDGVVTFTVTTKDKWESNQVTELGYAILKNNKDQTNPHKFEEVMMNHGDTALPYEPYTESTITLSQPIDLYGIGDVQDVIDVENGVVERKFYKFIGDHVSVFDAEKSFCHIYMPNDIATSTGWNFAYENMLSNLFDEVVSRNNLNSNLDWASIALTTADDGKQYITFRITSIEQTEEAYNTFLANTPIEVVFERADYIVEPLPLADKMALNSLKSFDGITYISTDSEVEPVITTEYGTSKTSAHAIEALNKAGNVEVEISEIKEDIETEIKPAIKELQTSLDITPTTSTTMPNSHDGRLLVNEIGGVGEQKTYQGYNILDMRNAKGDTNAGITVTMNPDGSYSYVGTATNAEINVWLVGSWIGTPTLFTIPAGKYFMQGVNLYNNGKPVFVGGREGSIIVLSEDTPVTGVRAVGAVAGTTYNETHYPIIARSEGRVYRWEPYTGGIPSPNPDYPQEIKHVRGKNLLKNDTLSMTHGGVTYTVNEDGSITANGVAASGGSKFVITGYDLPDGELIMNGCPKGGSQSTYSIRYSNFVNKVYDDLGDGINITKFDKATYPDQEIQLRIAEGYTANNLAFKPMIRKASIADPTYVPYGLLRLKTRGKNLLPYTDGYKYSASGITVEAIGDGYSYKVYGTATGPIAIQIPMSINSKKVCIFSSNLADSDNSNIRLYYTENGSTTIKALAPTKTIDLSANEIKTLAFYIGSGATVNTVVKVQLEEGAVATDYAPYKESSITLSQPIDLYGIGDVQDVIEDGKVKRRFAKVVFDGSTDEAWQPNATIVGTNYRKLVPLPNAKLTKDPYTVPDLLCTDYIANTPNDNFYESEGITVGANSSALVVYDKNYNTNDTTSWRTHLQSKPMTVVYELANEVIEELPLADQIALNSLSIYDGITYLEFDSEIEPTFEGEYGTSKVGGYTLEGMLAGRNGEMVAKSNADRLSALETTLVNNI